MSPIEKKVTTSILRLIRARRLKPLRKNDRGSGPGIGEITPAKLREARFSDCSEVIKLKQRGGLTADSPHNWERLWRRNPALVGMSSQPPIGWVLEADGAIVGYLGNIAQLYHYRDETLVSVTAHGFVADPAYRAVSLSLAAAYFRQKSVDLFISTTAIEAVGKIARAFKSDPVPQLDYDTVLFWVLRPHGFARGLMKKLEVAPAWAGVGSVMTAIAVGAMNILRSRRLANPALRLQVSEIGVEEIGDEFQALWAAKLAELKGRPRLFADRSPAALRWHFEVPGDEGLVRILCCYGNTSLAGYAVVRTDTSPLDGLRKSVIADLVALEDDAEIVRSLWRAAIRHAKLAGSDVLEVMGFPANIRRVMSAMNPYSRKYPSCPFYYKTAESTLHQALSDGMVWYASPFDGDATLIRPSYSGSASDTVFEDASPSQASCAEGFNRADRSEEVKTGVS